MAQQPIQRTFKHNTLTVQEEYEYDNMQTTPKGRPSPALQRRPLDYSLQSPGQAQDLITFSPDSPSRGADAIINDVSQIVSDFQDSCDEVMANLTRLQQSAEGSPSSSPGTAAGAPAYTNLVKPKIEEMLTVTDFAQTYTDERTRHLNDLQSLIEENQLAIELTQESLDKFDNAIEKGSEFLPRFIKTWNDYADGFAQTYSNMMIQTPPLPNLNAIEHPSPSVNQETYAGLVWDMVSMCHVAERQCRLNEVMYSDLDGLTERLKKSLENGSAMLQKIEGIRQTLAKEDLQVMNSFKEKEDNIKRFLGEWEKGPEELNQPERTPITSPDWSTSKSTPCSQTDRSTSCSKPSSPVQKTTPNSTSSSLGSKSSSPKAGPVDEIVQRFADMKNVALQELQGLKEQQNVLEQSMNAVKNVPDTSRVASNKATSEPPAKTPESSGERNNGSS